MTLEAGMVVGGDFRVDSRLREGGMGQVWVAEQLSIGRKRALKVMRRELVSDAKLRERFVLEARVGATIESDHVVEVVAAGIDDKLGVPWLAMELLEGSDLEAAIAERGLPWEDVAEIADQLGHALAAAHAVGVVHRDLKPENIFLARSRRSGGAPFDVKVLDFGLAKLVEGALATSGQSALIGTPLYMAPEQTEVSRPATSAIDVWALGLIVYRALTGRYFWRSAREGAQTITSVMREVLFDPIPPASVRAGEDGRALMLPPGFDEWFARCLAREPQARFAHGGEACRALSTALDAERGSGAPPRAPVPEPAQTMPRSSVPEAFEATIVLPSPVVDVLHEGPDFSFGRIADIFVVRWWLTPTVESAAEMDAVMTRAVRDAVGPVVVMPVMDTALKSPAADARDAHRNAVGEAHAPSDERLRNGRGSHRLARAQPRSPSRRGAHDRHRALQRSLEETDSLSCVRSVFEHSSPAAVRLSSEPGRLSDVRSRGWMTPPEWIVVCTSSRTWTASSPLATS